MERHLRHVTVESRVRLIQDYQNTFPILPLRTPVSGEAHMNSFTALIREGKKGSKKSLTYY